MVDVADAMERPDGVLVGLHGVDARAEGLEVGPVDRVADDAVATAGGVVGPDGADSRPVSDGKDRSGVGRVRGVLHPEDRAPAHLAQQARGAGDRVADVPGHIVRVVGRSGPRSGDQPASRRRGADAGHAQERPAIAAPPIGMASVDGCARAVLPGDELGDSRLELFDARLHGLA